MNNFKDNKTYAKIRDPNSFWYTVGQKFQGCECVIYETKEDSYVVELCDTHQKAILGGLSVGELSTLLRPAVPEKQSITEDDLLIFPSQSETDGKINYFWTFELSDKFHTKQQVINFRARILDGQKALEEQPKLKSDYEIAERLVGKFADENQKLKVGYNERVSTANKIIGEKIDEIKLLKAEIEELKRFKEQYDIPKMEKLYELQQESKQAIQVMKILQSLDLCMIYDAIMVRGNYNAGKRWQALQSILKGEQE